MSEAGIFNGLPIQTSAQGRTAVVFRLITPALKAGEDADGTPNRLLVVEVASDEASLVERIENLRSRGLDASVSELALQAVRAATAQRPGPDGCGPGFRPFVP